MFCLNKRMRQEFFWEHLGMMDLPEYAADAVEKISIYGMHGIILGKNFIITAETSKKPLDERLVDKYIDEYLM